MTSETSPTVPVQCSRCGSSHVFLTEVETVDGLATRLHCLVCGWEEREPTPPPESEPGKNIDRAPPRKFEIA